MSIEDPNKSGSNIEENPFVKEFLKRDTKVRAEELRKTKKFEGEAGIIRESPQAENSGNQTIEDSG